MMATVNNWLPLAEYSMKHQVSVSTLRRRIKTEDIQFRFDDGKYFILDELPKITTTAEEHRPSLKSDVQKNSAPVFNHAAETGESVITAANKLLLDLKKAYTQILHEKEEQIMNLKEEVVDLNTLVKILESENSRLRDYQQ